MLRFEKKLVVVNNLVWWAFITLYDCDQRSIDYVMNDYIILEVSYDETPADSGVIEWIRRDAVSYTHLTLPTICSV